MAVVSLANWFQQLAMGAFALSMTIILAAALVAVLAS
jgi:hypothetical protein